MRTKIILLTMLFIGCGTKPTDSPPWDSVNSIVQENKSDVYSDILHELVIKHFYQLYLGPSLEDIEKKFGYNRDNPEYKNEVDKLRTAVESDTSIQSKICIRSEFSFIKYQLSIENFNDSIDNPHDLRNIFKNFSTNYRALYDSLTTPQKFYPGQLKSSSFSVGNSHCYIGMISFSKIFYNKHGDKGLLYYEFVCGAKCGKGELLWIENNAGRWTIEKNKRLWIL